MRTVRGLAALAGLAVLAPPASGAPTPHVLARGTAEPVRGALVRTNAAGDLMVTWSDGRRVRASFRLNGGRFGAAHAVPGLRSAKADLTGAMPLMASGAGARIAWAVSADATSLLVATAQRGGPFAAPQAVRAPAGSGLDRWQLSGPVVVGPDGHAAIVARSRRALAALLGDADGHWRAPQTLPASQVAFARIAVGGGGGAVLAWSARGPCGPQPPGFPPQPVATCEFVRASLRPPGGAFGAPVTLDAGQYHVGPPRPIVDAAGRPGVFWWRSLGQAGAAVLARGRFAVGFGPAVALPGTDRPTADACPPSSGTGAAPEPRVVAVRPRPDGGAFVLVDRDEGCGPLISEVPLAPDGTAGAPVRLTAAPLAPKLGMDFLGLGGRTPALVTRTAAGAVAVARTAPEAPFAAPIAVALPARARRGPTAVLRDGRVVVAFSRPCRPGSHVSEAVVVAPGGTASKPVRLSRCGDPSPVQVDRTGRAVFVARRAGDLVAWATAPIG